MYVTYAPSICLHPFAFSFSEQSNLSHPSQVLPAINIVLVLFLSEAYYFIMKFLRLHPPLCTILAVISVCV
jgi:hypothetical protein